MSINESIWGNSASWQQYYGGSIPYEDIKIAGTTIPTLASYYGTTGTDDPDIDLSLSPWGIGGGSWMCNTFLGASWTQNGNVPENPYNMPFGYAKKAFNADKQAGKQHPMILFSNQDVNGTVTEPLTNLMPAQGRFYPKADSTAPSYLGKQTLTYDSTYNGFVTKPILQFNYKKLLLIPWICGYRPADNTSHIMYLDDFCNNTADVTADDNIAGWRAQNIHITGIGYSFANGEGGSGNPRDWSTDDALKSFNIGTVRSLGEWDFRDLWWEDNLPQPFGNVPAEAYHIQKGGQFGVNYVKFANTTMLSLPNRQSYPQFSDINGGPFAYWYDRVVQDQSSNLNSAYTYWTGGEDWVFEAVVGGQPYYPVDEYSVAPGTGDFVYRYMRWNIDDLSDTEVANELWKQVAYLGFCFTNDHTKLNGVVGEDNEVCIPTFENGITTGNYVFGEAAKELPNYLWDDDIWDKNDYDPYYDDGGHDQKDFGDLDNSDYRGINLLGSNMYYALTEDELKNFLYWLNGLYTTGTGQVEKLETDFKGSNPSDYIVGIYSYPCPIPAVSTTDHIMIGPVTSNLSTNYVDRNGFGALTFGVKKVPKFFADFRDYKPYTTMELYLPFAGTVELDPAFWVGRSMAIDIVFDINTGMAQYKVIRDDTTVDRTIDFALGCQIPVTARNLGDFQNNIHQIVQASYRMSISSVEQTVNRANDTVMAGLSGPVEGLKAGVSAIPGNVFGGLKSYVDYKEIEYALTHSPCKVAVTSTADTHNAFNMYAHPILFIKRAETISGYDQEIYSRTVGNACCINTTIGTMSGFTVASNIDTSGISATIEEINLIKQSFNNGVYV